MEWKKRKKSPAKKIGVNKVRDMSTTKTIKKSIRYKLVKVKKKSVKAKNKSTIMKAKSTMKKVQNLTINEISKHVTKLKFRKE